ncbi:cytochrome P450 734A1-like protein [Tanacetum coccineum]
MRRKSSIAALNHGFPEAKRSRKHNTLFNQLISINVTFPVDKNNRAIFSKDTSPKYIPTKKNKLRWKLEKETTELIRKLIEKNKDAIQHPNTLLASLISPSKKDDILDLKEIVDECKTFYFAGKETTANLLTWAFLILALQQEWQNKAREEVIGVCGHNDFPCANDLANLKIVSMILNETLRLYPPAVMMMRQASQNVKLGGTLDIPAGTQLFLAMTAIHHDTKLWGGDANEFNPMRFVEPRNHLASFFPFGLGSRVCVGQNLAMVEAKIVLAMIVRQYSFVISPTYVHAPMQSLTLQPQFGAQIIFSSWRDGFDCFYTYEIPVGEVVDNGVFENERPIVTVAKHRTVTLLPTSVVHSSGELSASVEREFVGDASVGDGGDQGFDSVGGQDNIEPTVPGLFIGVKDKEIEEFKSQLLKAKEESVEEYNGLLEQECGSLKLKVTSLESTIAEKDRELSDLGASSSSLKSQNQSLVNQVHELETSSTDLREKLEMYEGSLKRLEEFQDNLMRPLETRLAEIDADFTRCCMRFQESFHPHLLNVVAGRRWLLTHGMKLLMAKCLNSTEYMEALGHAFGRAIEKGMQEGLAAGIEHGQAGRCLTDLEAYIPSAEVDFNSAVRDLRDLNFPLLQELSNKKDASTWDIMDLLRLDDVVAEALSMTDLQPDVSQLMVHIHHKQDRVVIGSQALSVALDICRGRVEKMERNLVERLPFLKDVFVSLDHPLSAEALIEPPVEVPATNVLSTVVIVPHSGPSVSVEDYENPDLVDVVPENVTPGPEGEENIDAATGGDLAFSKLDDEARDAVL